MPKITTVQVNTICVLLKKDIYKVKYIAEYVGCKERDIYNIIHGISFKKIAEEYGIVKLKTK